jgi:hypothetical protein
MRLIGCSVGTLGVDVDLVDVIMNDPRPSRCGSLTPTFLTNFFDRASLFTLWQNYINTIHDRFRLNPTK